MMTTKSQNVLIRIIALTMLSAVSSNSIAITADSNISPPTSVPATSTMPAPPITTPRIKCPQLVINNQTLTRTSAPINFGGATCNGGYSGGGLAIVAGVVSGAFIPECPPEQPYMGAIDEGWGGTIILGSAGMTVTCCSIPQTPLKMINDDTRWQNSPLCP